MIDPKWVLVLQVQAAHLPIHEWLVQASLTQLPKLLGAELLKPVLIFARSSRHSASHSSEQLLVSSELGRQTERQTDRRLLNLLVPPA